MTSFAIVVLLMICFYSTTTTCGAATSNSMTLVDDSTTNTRQSSLRVQRKLLVASDVQQQVVQLSCTEDSFDCYEEGNNDFQLTEGLTYNTRSAVWADTLLDLQESFVIQAQILMDSRTHIGGEGMALVFQTEGNQALGASGNGKGYQGIQHPLIAIDIDTHHDGSGIISITKNTPTNVLSQIGSANIGYVLDLRLRTLRVEYNAVLKQIKVYFDGNQVLGGPLDLVAELQLHTATWGFTASSGETSTSDQWVYFEKFEQDVENKVEVVPASPTSFAPSVAPSNDPSDAPSSFPTTFSPTTKVYLLKEDFDSPTDKWVYKPNLFRETTGDLSRVVGERSSTHFGKWYNLESSGGLRLQLTSSGDDGGSEPVSGGWETTFTLMENVQSAILDFKYRVDFDDGFLANEMGQVVGEVNGLLTVIETIHGSNDASSSLSYLSFWGDAKIELGDLAAGTHQIKIGGYLSAPKSQDKVFQIRFDNVSVTGVKDTIRSSNSE